jgi:hypothetical protein
VRVPLRGFVVDVILAGVAGALGWHPVYDFLHAHAKLVYWGGGSLHIALISVLCVQMLFGNTKGADLIGQQQGPLHERLYVWSTVLTSCTSFCAPFVCGLMLPVSGSLAFAMAIVFAPWLALFGTMSLALIPALRRTDPKIPNPLASSVGRVAIGAAITVYLALEETTLFMCAESGEKASGVAVFFGLFLTYLPVRLFLFYNVTATAHRAEVASIFASFAFLSVEVAASMPNR